MNNGTAGCQGQDYVNKPTWTHLMAVKTPKTKYFPFKISLR